MKFEPRAAGVFSCPTYLPWIGSHLNPEELERATETIPGARKDEPQREGLTAYGREVAASWEDLSEGLPGGVAVWRNWITGQISPGWGVDWRVASR